MFNIDAASAAYVVRVYESELGECRDYLVKRLPDRFVRRGDG